MALFDRKKNTDEATKQPTNEEQMARRQSAPRPTIKDAVMDMVQRKGNGMMPSGATNGFNALAQVIGKEQINQANLTLQKYKEGKANLEKNIVEN